MIVRFFDVVIDKLQDGQSSLVELNEEFRLSVPDRDLNDVLERTENKVDMMDAVSNYTGYDICSFGYEVVE